MVSTVGITRLFFVFIVSSDAISYPFYTLHTQAKDGGVWTEWASWSPCSRTCGIGVSTKTRTCLSSRQRGAKPSRNCSGPTSVTMICNPGDCPAGSPDFLQTQCAKYNGKPLAGASYDWVPFYHGSGNCALNCRAVGHRFYATLRPKALDGTPCRRSNQVQPTHLCINGVCEEVGCDGVVGSGARRDLCGVCRGNNTGCRLVSGLFTRPQLQHGYNIITQIPQLASNITVTQIRPTLNYLALRKKDGSYIINGNWAINLSGEYTGAGTKFYYQRDDSRNSEGEYISSPGPLAEPVDLMIIYQQPNPGIKYQYRIPLSVEAIPSSSVMRHPQTGGPAIIRHPHTLKNTDGTTADNSINYASGRLNKPGVTYGRDLIGAESQSIAGDEAVKQRVKTKKKKFVWKISGFSECTKTCGGGIQTAIMVCIRESNEVVVPDKRCSSIEKHSLQPKRCNIKPCIADWVAGDWSSCSVSCGEGVETREVLCRQEISPTLTITVANAACLTQQPTSSRKCYLPACHNAPVPNKWQVGHWSECSTGCGIGVKTRTVHCPSGDCPHNERPPHIMQCNLGPCKNSKGYWLYTEWSHQCSEECGKGVQTRRVLCFNGECDQQSRPESTRACSSDKKCSGQWFAGPWQMCSGSCGTGEQWRNVLCIAHLHGEGIVTSEANCRNEEKPNTVQKCQLSPCSPRWYSGDWSDCSRTCDSGLQRREVWCLDESYSPSTTCNEIHKPTAYHVCNANPCTVNDGDVQPRGETGKDTIKSLADNTSRSNDCADKLHNCHMVAQARLCQYKYYSSSCCHSCLNKS